MNRQACTLPLMGVLFTVSACCGGPNGVHFAVVPREGTALDFQHRAFLPVNDTAQLKAEAWYYGGFLGPVCRLYDINTHPELFRIASEARDIATADSRGLLFTRAAGETRLTVSAESARGEMFVSVSPLVSELTLTTSAQTVAPDDTLRFEVNGLDADGASSSGVYVFVMLVPPSDSAGRWVNGGGSSYPLLIRTPGAAELVVDRVGRFRVTAYVAHEPGWPRISADTIDVTVRIRRTTP